MVAAAPAVLVSGRAERPGFVCLSHKRRGLHETPLIDRGRGWCLYRRAGLGAGGSWNRWGGGAVSPQEKRYKDGGESEGKQGWEREERMRQAPVGVPPPMQEE